MKYQKLLSLTRQAVDTYQMIDEGDHIAVGISGGKDSLTLLCALYGLKRFYPKSFDLTAITVNLGFQNLDLEPIKRMCRTFEIPYKIVDTQIARIIFEERRENNPCSLCAKMRKGALNAAIKELGCNKIAYAHHKDDVIETMLLSLLYEGRFYSFPPKTYLDQMDLTVIRPLFFVDEADVIGFWHKYQLPVAKSPCPADGHTRREYSKQLLRQLNLENPGVKNRMFTAILNAELSDWPDRIILTATDGKRKIFSLLSAFVVFGKTGHFVVDPERIQQQIVRLADFFFGRTMIIRAACLDRCSAFHLLDQIGFCMDRFTKFCICRSNAVRFVGITAAKLCQKVLSGAFFAS